MAIQTIFGPYRAKPYGELGMWHVVEMVDNSKNIYEELRPSHTYLKRESAYRLMARLNRKWQSEHQNEPEILEYWQQATN